MLVWGAAISAIIIWSSTYIWMLRIRNHRIKTERSEEAKQHLALYGQTEKSLHEVISRFPDAVEPLQRWVELAYRSGQVTEAVLRAKQICDKFPNNPVGFIMSANALLRCGRRSEAEALIDSAIKKLGRQSNLLLCRACLAQDAADHTTAIQRFDAFRRLFPKDKEGYVKAAESCHALKRFEDAEVLLTEVVEKRLGHIADHTLTQWARYAEQRKDWRTAFARWNILGEVNSLNMESYLGKSRALRHTKQWVAAADIANSAKTLFPNDTRVDAELQFVHLQTTPG